MGTDSARSQLFGVTGTWVLRVQRQDRRLGRDRGDGQALWVPWRGGQHIPRPRRRGLKMRDGQNAFSGRVWLRGGEWEGREDGAGVGGSFRICPVLRTRRGVRRPSPGTSVESRRPHTGGRASGAPNSEGGSLGLTTWALGCPVEASTQPSSAESAPESRREAHEPGARAWPLQLAHRDPVRSL